MVQLVLHPIVHSKFQIITSYHFCFYITFLVLLVPFFFFLPGTHILSFPLCNVCLFSTSVCLLRYTIVYFILLFIDRVLILISHHHRHELKPFCSNSSTSNDTVLPGVGGVATTAAATAAAGDFDTTAPAAAGCNDCNNIALFFHRRLFVLGVDAGVVGVNGDDDNNDDDNNDWIEAVTTDVGDLVVVHVDVDVDSNVVVRLKRRGRG